MILNFTGSIFVDIETVGHLLLRRRKPTGVDGLLPIENAPPNRVPDGHGRNSRIHADAATSELWLCGQRRRRDTGEMHGRAEATQVGRVQTDS